MKNKTSDYALVVDPRGRRRLILTRVAQLLFLAVVADLAVVLAELAVGQDPYEGFQQHPFLFLYLFLTTIVAYGVFGAVLGSREALLNEMALRDSLTGLLNSRYLQARLEEELAAAERHGRPTSLVLFDIDHFKKVNDVYGHPVGDQVLQLVGETIQSTLRHGEIAARVGGEEFALLLPRTEVAGAVASAERIRKAVSVAVCRTKDGQQLSVTASAGVACSATDAAALYSLADQALYQAKEQGRDRVVIGESKNCFVPSTVDRVVPNLESAPVERAKPNAGADRATTHGEEQ